MSDVSLIDTNVIIYLLGDSDSAKSFTAKTCNAASKLNSFVLLIRLWVDGLCVVTNA